MLILTRKVGEAIVVDGKIIVRVVQTRGDQVRIGIEAPREIPIYRSELIGCQLDKAQKKKAGDTDLLTQTVPLNQIK